MLRIDRYILSQLLTLFGFFALVLVSVYWLNRALSLFEQLIADGQTALVVLEFTVLTLPVVIALVLPVAGFAAVVYGVNRMSGDSELTAMQTAGLSPWRLAWPVLVFGVLVGLMVAMLVHDLVPGARARLAQRQAQLAENLATHFLQPGSFQYPAPGMTLYIRSIASDGRLLDLMLEDAKGASRTLYTAREALFLRGDSGPRLMMIDGMAEQTEAQGAAPRLGVTRFSSLIYDFAPLGGGDGRRTDLREVPTMTLLRADAEMLEASGVSAMRARAVGHQRLAQPFLSPVAALLGFATLISAGFSRFGLTRQIGLAILLLVGLQFLVIAAENMAEGRPALWPLLYLPPVIGAGVVAGLLAWAGRRRRPRGDAA